ncbi:MAG: hypothetical protein JWR60_3285 [Polaromonas sp.]|nr:hypothetical protein [Polaromonas sp.]
MSQFPDHGINDPDIGPPHENDDQNSYRLPSAEAVLTGTLALMTAYARGCCDSHREPMMRKIIDNLLLLSRYSAASPGFRSATSNLRAIWLTQLDQLHEAACGCAPADARGDLPVAPWPASPGAQPAFWHASPETIQ